MKIDNSIFNGYENMRLVRYDDVAQMSDSVPYDELPHKQVTGVLKSSMHVDGKLVQS